MSKTLEELNQEFKGSSVEKPNYPALKIDHDEDSAAYGQLYIEKRWKDESTGKWEKKRKDLKAAFADLTILKRRYMFMYYDQVGGVMIATTNEFDKWQDDVHVLGEGRIMKSGHYTSEVKPWLCETWPKGQGGHMMRLSNILYVALDGAIYRMSLSNTSVQGVKKEMTDPATKNSLEGYMGALWKTGKHPVSFTTNVKAVLKNKKIGGKKLSFYAFDFEMAKEQLKAPMDLYNEMDTAITAYDEFKFGSIASGDILDQEVAPVTEVKGLSADDLPFDTVKKDDKKEDGWNADF